MADVAGDGHHHTHTPTHPAGRAHHTTLPPRPFASNFAPTQGDDLAATGDGIAALLHMVRSPRADVQLHSVTALGFACHNEGNRQRVALLGGVPLLLELCTPFPWRQPELLRRAAHTLGHLTLNTEAQVDAHQQGGWKSLLLLAKSADAQCWYDALRSLANLASHEPLRAPLLNTGALALALSFFRHAEVDLQVLLPLPSPFRCFCPSL